VTAKRKKLLYCARTRARVREGCYRYFHISLFIFPHPLFSLSTSPKNDLSFYEKQAVTLKKTTRRFKKVTRRYMENNQSFYEKQAVTLYKSPHRWKQRKKSCTHNLHKYKHKENFHAQKTRRWAENKRRDVEKQRKSNEDIAKQKRHLPPICLKKVY